jgi:hypothetical protein
MLLPPMAMVISACLSHAQIMYAVDSVNLDVCPLPLCLAVFVHLLMTSAAISIHLIGICNDCQKIAVGVKPTHALAYQAKGSKMRFILPLLN